MIQDFQDFGSLRNEKFIKRITKFDIRKAVKEVVNIQYKQSVQKRINFSVEFTNIAESTETVSGS